MNKLTGRLRSGRAADADARMARVVAVEKELGKRAEVIVAKEKSHA